MPKKTVVIDGQEYIEGYIVGIGPLRFIFVEWEVENALFRDKRMKTFLEVEVRSKWRIFWNKLPLRKDIAWEIVRRDMEGG